MQTQQLEEVPSFLESNIMQSVQLSKTTNSSPVSVQSIIIFGLLMGLYVLTSLVFLYYFPNNKSLADFKTILSLSILVWIVYELNEIFSRRFIANTMDIKMNLS